ncbi:WD repeat-containing protein 7 [Geranomyces variabilis]|nr:WD repeat-containing protein 7 [Geranomyces variabilis]
MTSLIAPLGCWIASPFATPPVVTAACGTEDGRLLVLGFEGGVAWIFTIAEDGSSKLEPKVMLAGHKSRITVITLGKIEVEGVAKHENMVLTASDAGEAIMWDIIDGRCLQASANAFEGTITAMKMTSSGKHVLCVGHASYIAVLDSSSLVVVRQIPINGNWIESLFLYPTEAKYVDRIYYTTISGELCTSTIDEQALSLVQEHTEAIERTAPSASAALEVNRFDNSMALLVEAHSCSVFDVVKSKLQLSCKLPCLENAPWVGGKFLSAKSVLLWTTTEASIYYIGLAKDVIKADQMSSTPDGAVFLFRRGDIGWYVKRMDTGRPQEPRSFTLVHSLRVAIGDHDACTFMCHVYGKDSGTHHHFAFDNAGNISHWQYFAGQNVKQSAVGEAPLNPNAKSSPDTEYTFDTTWPLQHEPQPQIVAVTSVLNRLAALGYDNGVISILPISTIFQPATQWASEIMFSLQGHHGPVTSLFVPTGRESAGKNLLISGGDDCSIKIWSMDDGKMLASFVNHAAPILSIFAAPSDTGTRFKNAVLAVAADNSVSVIDLEDLSCPCRLSGHPSRIAALHWRTLDEVLIVETVDGESYVWQLKTGHLDRILDAGSDSEDILDSSDCSVNCLDLAIKYCDANTRRSLSTYSVHMSENEPPVLVTFLINTKRLISEIYGQQLATPPPTPPLSAAGSAARILPPSVRRTSSLHADAGLDPRASPARGHGQHFGHQVTQNIMEIFRSRPGSPAAGASAKPNENRSDIVRPSTPKDGSGESLKDSAITEAPDMDVVQSIFEAMLSWGIDKEKDALFQERAELRPPGSHVAFGMRGATGQLSFMAPQKSSASDWTLSSTVSAARLLNIVSLARALFIARGLEEDLGQLVTFYSAALPSIIGRRYAFASFSYLAKYWQDPVADVQVAARTLFSLTLQKMSTEEKTAGIEYWRTHLPNISKHSQKLNMRAVIILGIIGSIQPELLNIRICKDVAESLDQLLREDNSRNLYRVPAIELLGSGFPLWEPHINGTAVLRTLIAFSGLATPPAALTTTNGSGASSQQQNVPPPIAAAASPAVMIVSRQAIVQIASCNPALFISTLTMDLMHSKSASERAGSLKLLGMFIAKKPLVLLNHLGRVVEAIVKCLDPNLPHIRDALQPIVTVNFAELVKRFPNVAFHHASQRLAVGTMDGVGVVYDVRIAARVQIMEGHTKSITAVSFSPDGKLIATFSLEENMVRIWQPAGGFLGTLVGALTTGGAASGAAGVAALASVGGVGHMKCFRTFAVGPPDANAMKDPAAVLDAVKFEWKGDRQVMLHSVNGLQLAFSV